MENIGVSVRIQREDIMAKVPMLTISKRFSPKYFPITPIPIRTIPKVKHMMQRINSSDEA